MEYLNNFWIYDPQAVFFVFATIVSLIIIVLGGLFFIVKNLIQNYFTKARIKKIQEDTTKAQPFSPRTFPTKLIKTGMTTFPRSTAAPKTIDKTHGIEVIMKEKDPFFTAEELLAFAKNVLTQLQFAFLKQDLEPLKEIMHNSLYQRFQTQINESKENGIVNHLEQFSVNQAGLISRKNTEQFDFIVVYAEANMINYQTKGKDGDVVSGFPNELITFQYHMTFARSINQKTENAFQKTNALICPNCAAPLTGLPYGVCDYCGSVITAEKYDWILYDYVITHKKLA